MNVLRLYEKIRLNQILTNDFSAVRYVNRCQLANPKFQSEILFWFTN